MFANHFQRTIAVAVLVAAFAVPGAAQQRPAAKGDALPQGAVARLGTMDLRSGGQVAGLALSPDGKILASASAMGNVTLWDVATGKELHNVITHPWGIDGVRFTADGKTVEVNASSGAPVAVDVATGARRPRGELEGRMPGVPQRGVRSVTSADGQVRVTSGDNEKFLRVWNVATNKEIRQIPGLPWDAHLLAISGEGKTVAAAGFSDGRLLLFNVASGEPLHASHGHTRLVNAIRLLPDGKTLLTGGDDDALRVWDLATRKELRRYVRAYGRSAFSPDGKLAALFGRHGKLGVTDVATGKQIREFDPVLGGAGSLAFSADGKTVFAASNGIRSWDVASGNELKPIPSSEIGVFGMAASSDGRYLAWGGQHRLLTVWDLKADRQMHQFQVETTMMWVAFSADGRLLTCGGQVPIRVWEVASGKEVHRLEGHKQFALAVEFSPDGRTLAVGDADTQLRVWDLATGKALTSLAGHRGHVYGLAFAADGKRLFSGGMDSTVLVWDVSAPPWLPALPALDLGAKELEQRWAALGSDDAKAAYRAVWDLAAADAKAVPFLKERLAAVKLPQGDPDIARLIRDLDNARFKVREEASAALRKLGHLATAEVRNALAAKPSEEARRRLEAILAGAPRGGATGLTGESLRFVRAVWALERIGTAEARDLLRTLSERRSANGENEDAAAALRRLSGTGGAH